MTGWLNTIHQGHAMDVLRRMPDNMVDCVITSPPYWGLRSYGTEPVAWDGDPACQHEWKLERKQTGHKHWNQGGKVIPSNERGIHNGRIVKIGFCRRCGAWRGSLGLEPDLHLYLDHLMQIFDEVRRVLKPTGCLFVNLGDSYAGSGSPEGDFRNGKGGDEYLRPYNRKGVPAKSLCGIPERFAIAMTDAGWVRRNTIIWHKPNPMPSSASDRFTVDFEYVYFFVKQAQYWFERQFEPHLETSVRRVALAKRNKAASKWKGEAESKGDLPNRKNCGIGSMQPSIYQGGDYMVGNLHPQGRNMRTTWTIPASPFPDAHFATFPAALVAPMLLAGCPEFVCSKCGKGRQNEPLVGLTDCGCGAGFVPGVALDPFMGAGTVALVARQNRRDFVGIELSADYIRMAEERLKEPKNAQVKLI